MSVLQNASLTYSICLEAVRSKDSGFPVQPHATTLLLRTTAGSSEYLHASRTHLSVKTRKIYLATTRPDAQKIPYSSCR